MQRMRILPVEGQEKKATYYKFMRNTCFYVYF